MEFDNTKFKKMMTDKGLKTSWIADRAGVNQESVRAWLRGDRTPRYAAIKLLCQLLNCKEEDFYKSSEAS